MNTGFLGTAVATVLTVYGIETNPRNLRFVQIFQLQQYLPFTVLKHVPCAMETSSCLQGQLQQYLPFTVLKRIRPHPQ